MNNKVTLCTIILPRLEVFFLEEWIQHHLALGVNTIYIFNNGLTPVASKDAHWRDNSEYMKKVMITAKEKSLKVPESKLWEKKPHVDYFLDYSDKEIMDKLNTVVGKYPQVKLISWIHGKDHDYGYPRSQQKIIPEVLQIKKELWLLHLDPDEFLRFTEDTSIQSFINNNPTIEYFTIPSRRAILRKRDKSVKESEILGPDEPTKFLAKVSIKHYDLVSARIPGSWVHYIPQVPRVIQSGKSLERKICDRSEVFYSHHVAGQFDTEN